MSIGWVLCINALMGILAAYVIGESMMKGYQKDLGKETAKVIGDEINQTTKSIEQFFRSGLPGTIWYIFCILFSCTFWEIVYPFVYLYMHNEFGKKHYNNNKES